MNIAAIIRILILSVGFTITLIGLRIFYSGSLMYIFIVWNLFLAIIPLLTSSSLLETKNKYAQWALFGVWLLFLPNALYIITDLVHLKSRNPVPFWFDIILIFSAAINGLIIAYTSLRQVEKFLKLKVSSFKMSMILIGCLFLSSFGIYLGRFLRWNSWDIFLNPIGLLSEIFHRFTNPLDHPRTWMVTIVFTIFFSVFYFTIKKLPQFINNKS